MGMGVKKCLNTRSPDGWVAGVGGLTVCARITSGRELPIGTYTLSFATALEPRPISKSICT